MKYTFLKEKLERKENGIKETAAVIGITEESLRLKLEGKLPLFVHEACMICAACNIVTLKDRLAFFYPDRPKSGINAREEEDFNT